MGGLIKLIRYSLVSTITVVAYLLFFPITLFFETLAFVVCFVILFFFAVLVGKDALEKSWINKYPVMPKVTNIGVKNMYLWAGQSH
jgi:uncharacterized SAM-binding protein YcdF (DUF218 family)